MYQTKLYTFPEGARDFTDGISIQRLEQEFNLLSQRDYEKESDLLDNFTFIDRKELRQELKKYGHYLTARNDIILAIVKN